MSLECSDLIHVSNVYQNPQYATFNSEDFVSDLGNVIINDINDIYALIRKIFESLLTNPKINYSTTVEYENLGYLIPTETSNYTLNFLKELTFPNFEDLITFLSVHKDILPVVIFGCTLATEMFPDKSEFSLSVENEDAENKYLVLTIRLQNYEENIMKKIDAICEQYWEDIIDKSALFFVTTDFTKPKVIQ